MLAPWVVLRKVGDEKNENVVGIDANDVMNNRHERPLTRTKNESKESEDDIRNSPGFKAIRMKKKKGYC